MKKNQKELPLVMDFMIFEGQNPFGETHRKRVYHSKERGYFIKHKGIDIGVKIHPTQIVVPNIDDFKRENKDRK